jgi:putative membrane protein
MTEPLKPRIDFTGTLEQNPQEAFKTAQTFSGTRPITLPRRCRTTGC